MWKRRDDRTGERWKVTARFHFEVSSSRLMRAVRVHCFGGYSDGMVRHMSEDRLLRSFAPVTEKDLANRRRR
jgi:hypothetical protein